MGCGEGARVRGRSRRHDLTGVLAALILAALLVIFAIDRPFTGSVVVSQEALRAVLQDFPSDR